MRISAAVAVACLTMTGLSMADQAEAAVRQSTNISAQGLGPALQLLAKERDIQVVYRSELVADRRTGGAVGEFTMEEALMELLNGTGLTFQYLQDKGITIVPIAADSLSQGGAAGQGKGGSAEKGASFRNRFRIAQAVTLSQEEQGKRADGELTIEEVIITAQKRTESLQDVPISVQVVSGQILSERNYNSLSELTKTVPGVYVATADFANTIYIRGVGTSPGNPAFEQSVATFVDDIYRGRSRLSNAAFLDLERVEFLKGPQSTFFGNNAIAGALNLVSKKPGDRLEGMARALYGSYEQYALEGAVGGPVSDKLGIRVAATLNGVDKGWMENINTGESLPVSRNLAGRTILAYTPIEDLELTLKVEASRSTKTGTAFDVPKQYTHCPPPPPLSIGSVYRECPTAIAEGVPVSGLDSDQVAGLAGARNRLEMFENVLTANYELGGHVLTSVTGYHYYDSLLNFDAANVRSWRNTTQQVETFRQVSQELRIASPTGNRFEYQAGIYYQGNHLDSSVQTTAPFLNALFGADPAMQPYLPWAFMTSFIQDEDLYSVFGSLSWNATDRLRLNAGLRGSRVSKDFDGKLHYGTGTQIYGGFVRLPSDLEQTVGLLGPPGESKVNERDDAWMPSLAIQYRPYSAGMLYVSYTRGFKAGGFNAIDPTNNAAEAGNGAYQPEYVNAYEVGFKSKWLHDRLLFNINLFRSDYEDLQVRTSIYNPPTDTYTAVIRNAAKSKSQGVELEMELAATSAWRFGANVAYLDARFVSYPNAATTALQRFNGLPVQDMSGRPTDFAPRWSGSIVVSYRTDLTEDYQLNVEVAPFFSSRFFSGDATADPLSEISGYVRLDARLSLLTVNRHWTVDLIGRNLTDRLIPIRYASGFGQKQEPRNVSMQLRYAF